MAPRVFLTADWRDLAMLNYAVEPALLRSLVPAGTELDTHEGRAFVSLVGFRFLRTAVLGLRFPFHRDFDEINLRFYVRRQAGNELRRGVVFVREIVPRFAIAAIARVFFNEKYVSRAMANSIQSVSDPAGEVRNVEYRWKEAGHTNRLSVECGGAPSLPEPGSLQQFITEHYWGYALQSDGGTIEYKVEHVPWRVWTASAASFKGETEALYGRELAALVKRPPASAFLAEGSPVTVFSGTRIRSEA